MAEKCEVITLQITNVDNTATYISFFCVCAFFFYKNKDKLGQTQGKSQEFVADWLEEEKPPKIKSVFEGTFILDCQEPIQEMRL